jgi:capsular exopolysaccharide synthesis family protein
VELQDYLRVLRKRWRLVAVCTLLALAGAAGATLVATPSYQAQAQVFISAGSSVSDLTSAYQGGSFTLQRVKSYAEIVPTPPVTQPVIEQLGLEMTPQELAEQIEATNPLDTVLLEISVSDPDPRLARDIANAVATQFTRVVRQLETPESGGPAPVKASVVKAADTPQEPESPRPPLNLALGLLVGLAVGVGGALLRETLDTTIKSTDEVKEVTGGPVLGTVPDDPQANAQPLVDESTRLHNPRVEAYRQIRTNLQFVDVDHPVRALVVTSAVPAEGKTLTAANLAVAIAESGRHVILVEADLRRPRVADYFGMEGAVGLTHVLIGQAAGRDLLQQFARLPLWVLASGPLPPNPSELLGSHQMGELLKQLGDEADLVLLDAPPLLPVTDAAVLAAQCDGALLVARHEYTTREQLAGAVGALDQVGAHLLGTVINRVPAKGGSRYGYAYGYGYGPDKPGSDGAGSGRPHLARTEDGEVTITGSRAARRARNGTSRRA